MRRTVHTDDLCALQMHLSETVFRGGKLMEIIVIPTW